MDIGLYILENNARGVLVCILIKGEQPRMMGRHRGVLFRVFGGRVGRLLTGASGRTPLAYTTVIIADIGMLWYISPL